MPSRRFPPPWTVEEQDTYFIVRDREGQQLAYVYFDDPRAAAKPLTRDEARRKLALDSHWRTKPVARRAAATGVNHG